MHVQCLTLITELEEALHIYKIGANPLVSLLRCPLCLCVCLLFSLIPCSNFLHLWELLFAKLPFMRSARTYMWAKCSLIVRVLRHASLHSCVAFREDAQCCILLFVIQPLCPRSCHLLHSTDFYYRQKGAESFFSVQRAIWFPLLFLSSCYCFFSFSPVLWDTF